MASHTVMLPRRCRSSEKDAIHANSSFCGDEEDYASKVAVESHAQSKKLVPRGHCPPSQVL
eukprot:10948871-Karenia_brevis.AAC.1